MKKILFLLLFSLTLISLGSAVLNVNFVSPTPANGSTVNTRNVTINATINSDNPLSSIIYNWNGTNYSIYDDSLILYYNFDNRSALGENDTIVKDISKYGNNGSVIGGNNISWINNGKYGGAYNFTGTSQIIINNNTITNFNESFTITGWVKLNSLSTSGGILSRDDGSSNRQINLNYDTSLGNLFRFRVFNSTGSSFGVSYSTSPIVGEWNYITATYNTTHIRLYVNTISTSSPLIVTGPIKNTPSLNISIGRYGTSNLNGVIDEIKVYNRSLTEEEINNEYNLGLNKLNQTQYILTKLNNLSGINKIDYGIYVNDTLNNNNSKIQNVRNLFNIIDNKINQIAEINEDFYGVSGGNIQYYSDTGLVKHDSNNDGNYDTLNNYTWHREMYLSSKMKVFRLDSQLGRISYSDRTFNTTNTNPSYNILEHQSTIEFAKNNNKKVIVIIRGTPSWLANTTTGWCTTSGTNSSCSPTNYTRWEILVQDYLRNITNNGLYNESIIVEVGNEPYLSSWLDNLSTDNIIKATEYIKLYNSTYNAIKEIYPNIPVGGPSGFRNAPNMTTTFLSNMTTKMDFISIHPYGYNLINGLEQLNDTNNLLTLCATYGSNCSRIILTEWNVGTSALQNLTYGEGKYENSFAESYISLLNNYPKNISSLIFQWSERYHYNYTAVYPDYPNKWTMINQIDNYEVSPSYNVTYKFTRYAPASSTVYNTSSDYSQIKLISTKNGNTNNVIITNTDTDSVNITLNTTANTLIDVETGTIYKANNSIMQLGVIDSYDIKYLTTPYVNLSESSAILTNYLGEQITTTALINVSDTTTTSTSITKHIASAYNLTANKISVSVTSCDYISAVTWTPKDGSATSPTYTCSNKVLTVYNVQVNPSATSNELLIEYLSSAGASNLCTTLTGSYPVFFNNVGSIMLILGVVLILGGIALVIGVVNGFVDLNFDTTNLGSVFENVDGKMLTAIILLIGLLGIIAVASIIAVSSLCGVG